jgi:hypothetical protein
MNKFFYKYILSKYLIGKEFNDYKDKKILNKFYIFNVNFDNKIDIYSDFKVKEDTCVVAVKNGKIIKILFIT